MSRFIVQDWRNAAAIAAEGPGRYVRCDAAGPDGVLCVYGEGHSVERHSWESDAAAEAEGER